MLGGTTRAALGAAATLAVGLILAGPAGAASGARVIEAQDACDPVTFNDESNPAIPPGGLCHRTDGNSGPRVTFAGLFDRLVSKGSHEAWRFDRREVTLKAGETAVARMGRAGELHTFTEVPSFGPGCVPPVNDAVFGVGNWMFPAACADFDAVVGATGLFPGRQLPVAGLSPGTHRFECLIHPWMGTTVTVE
jgi:hypothetical protein